VTTEAWGSEWDVVADVVVVGSGAAGGTAAATAALAGASVVVVEAAAFVGGTTGKSGGVMWLADNPVMRAAGTVDGRGGALRYMARTAFPAVYDPADEFLGIGERSHRLLGAFYDHGHDAAASLEDAGVWVLEHVPYPDYYADLPENEVPIGRVIQPKYPDGWRRDVDAKGGQLLAEALIRVAEQHGTTVLTGHRVVHVIRDDDDRVIGVEARVGLRTVLIGARRGVIFGSGGFLHDRQMRRDFLRGPVLGGGAVDEARGDFVRIGIEVGAQLGNMSHAWWDQVVVEHAVTVPSTIRDVYSPYGDSMLMVNRHGRRAVNEKAVYNERGQVHAAWDPTRGEYPNLLMFMIWDDAVTQNPEPSRFRWPVPEKGELPQPFVLSADTLEDLAAEIRRRLVPLEPHTGGVRLSDNFESELRATIERFNTFARTGRDLDFGRGEASIEKTWALTPRAGSDSGSMYPLSPSGPYHCVILGPGALDTKGGPVIDEHARVLGVDGQPIPGLYGAGNCIASPAGQAYWGPGGTIGPAITFGYIAARTAVGIRGH
jgi:3-oxosteroid 1-dehydrogenase